ncbi:MAG: hypothetical protein A3F72_18660 [Bacteroidetes bacterium RIFCSPLOWO2_12_FULL_35_15]|nr:MAG: hypothetical protein A3F72_18660 [Bacteroidetes bacterium RIFCSPLOWO2_12_FULL_35_15]
MKKKFITLLFLCFSFSFYAQNNYLDSLNNVVKTGSDTNKIKALFFLSDNYEYNDIARAWEYSRQIYALAHRLNIQKYIASSYIQYGNLYDDVSNSDSALFYYQKALSYSQQHDLKKQQGSALNGLGCVYLNTGDYSKSMENLLKALKIYETINYKSGQASCLNNMGLVARNTKKQNKAIEYYLQALAIKEEVRDTAAFGNTLNNIGLTYYETERYDQAMSYYFKALSFARISGDSGSTAMILQNIALIYNQKYDTKNALKYYESAMKLYHTLDDKNGEAITNCNLGMVYHRMHDDEKAIAFNLKALNMFREINSKDWIAEVYKNLFQIYSLKHDYEKALHYHVKFVELKDSLFTTENNRSLAEMETKYESEKKQKEIEILNQKAEIASIAFNKNRILLYSFVGGFLLILLMVLIIFNRYKIKKRANIALEQQNVEITLQKAIIEEKNKDITDSIRYARRIQEAILPSSDLIKGFFPDSFILYKPKDIVSGDFYYFHNLSASHTIVAAADCTGHGVPGAFMSLLGYNALEHAIKENKKTVPSDILDTINTIISGTLNQEKKDTTVMDGMDIALCSFDKESNQLNYAGANNPLWMFSDNQLKEFDADKTPIGAYSGIENKFTTHKIPLKKGDCFYIFSDGYADQFGGKLGKKFKYKQLKELLHAAQGKLMSEQKVILENAIDQWRGNLEQVDDILIIGIRV